MAFNPFHGFRKHQKAIFAVLTIICMFVFILQFGRGDALERLGGLFGGGRGKGETVIKLYGRDFTDGDLTKARQLREAANEAVMASISAAFPEATKNVEGHKADPKDDKLTRLIEDWRRLQIPQFSQGLTPQMRRELVQDQLRQALALKSNPPAAADKDDEDALQERARVIDDLVLLLKVDFWRLNPDLTRDSLFLGGTTKTEDMLDFEIWKHQADRLGIVFSKADARRELGRESANRGLPKDFNSSWKDDPALKGFFADQRYKDYPEDQLVTAVADEFRVLTAQDLIAGRTAGVPSLSDAFRPAPDPATPYEFWDYFRRQRTTVSVRVLDMPVEGFLKDVTQSPPDRELENLFEKWKSFEPAPDRADPAFKEPRRIQAEYITAKADGPLYKGEATRGLAAEFLSAQMLAAGNASTGDGGAASWAGLATGVHSLKAEFQEGYDRYVGRHSGDLVMEKYTKDKIAVPRVALTGGALLLQIQSGALPSANPLTAAAGYAGAVAADEHKADDTTAEAAAFALQGLAADNPLTALAGAAAYTTPTPPPPEMVEDRVVQQIIEERAPQILVRNLNTFIEELAKVKSDKVKAREYIDKAVKDYGFQRFAMEKPLDQYALPDDPALKTLKEALEQPSFFNQRAEKPTPWEVLTFGSGVYDPKRFSSDSGVVVNDNIRDQNYQIWNFLAKDRFVYWRIEDKSAREPLSLDDPGVRDKVEAAWRFRAAQRLANEKAKAIAKKVQTLPPVEADKELHEANLGTIFPLTKVARLVDDPTAAPGLSRTFSPYRLPPDRLAYPPDGLVETLLKLEKPGDATVFHDRPERHYYVAVLDDRSEPTLKDFRVVYQDIAAQGKDQLWNQYFLPKHQGDFQQNLLRALREEAGPVDEKTGKLQFTSRDSDAKQGR